MGSRATARMHGEPGGGPTRRRAVTSARNSDMEVESKEPQTTTCLRFPIRGATERSVSHRSGPDCHGDWAGSAGLRSAPFRVLPLSAFNDRGPGWGEIASTSEPASSRPGRRRTVS